MSDLTRRTALTALAIAATLAGSAAPALALNPQPLPPRWTPTATLTTVRPVSAVFLNPQPLPPGVR
jgi:hypothetical protein